LGVSSWKKALSGVSTDSCLLPLDSKDAVRFSHTDFELNLTKDDYLLYLGRLSQDKGIELAIQIAEYTKKRLLIAGPGNLSSFGYTRTPANIELVGYADLEKRKQLMKSKSIVRLDLKFYN
jgi:glycosyltransferase involved in cell wall biosynthesis